jgi:hypothetical protein
MTHEANQAFESFIDRAEELDAELLPFVSVPSRSFEEFFARLAPPPRESPP